MSRNVFAFTRSLNRTFGFRYGLRTTSRMENFTGMIRYGVAAKHDYRGGIGLTRPPPYQLVPSPRERFTIGVRRTELRDGDVVVIWFTVQDIAGNKDDVRMVVGLDRSRPLLAAQEQFTALDQFTSKYV